jgi:hypothetical protein
MKLADALLRRKELEKKVKLLEQFKSSDFFEVKCQRRSISDQVDDITAMVPKLEVNQVTQELDFYSHRLRLLDAAIQQCNWTCDIPVDDKVWVDYKSNKV